MGKKRGQKDRAYITASEWREEGGGHRGRLQGAGAIFKRLPFNCCAISFQPFEDPVCTPNGTTMDIINAVPYITKHKRHPATGAPLELKELTRLHFHKNSDGEYACPVLNKVFNENTHIVAIKPTGNVYCWEAVDELCLKPKNLRDLLTDEPYTKKDLIHLQDPLNLSGKNLAEFDHVKHGRMAEEELEKAEKQAADPLYGINAGAIAQDTQRALQALGSDEAAKAFEAGGGGKKAQAECALADAKAKEAAAAGKKTATTKTGNGGITNTTSDSRLRGTPRDPYANVNFKPGTHTWNTDAPAAKTSQNELNAGKSIPPPYSATWIEGHTSTGAASKSFTSTAMPVATKNEKTMVLQQLHPKKKGYLRLHTSLGDLNIELHCDLTPKTCENFMALAESGYYTGTKFHRSIKNFMIQGGDPAGTGKGGSSIYGPTFNDEIVPQLLHDGRGVLAMANSGKHTNGSQFFILYKSAPHLNFKHTVFGKVVGGFEVLTLMERIATDDEDRPVQDIEITGATVFVNPYTDLIEEEEKKKKAEAEKKKNYSGGIGGKNINKNSQFLQGTEGDLGAWFSDPGASGAAGGTSGGVGKYLKNSSTIIGAAGSDSVAPQPVAKKAKTSAGAPLANFDAW
jgi:peptidyl-prolyl cis-trans isomerase-like 2